MNSEFCRERLLGRYRHGPMKSRMRQFLDREEKERLGVDRCYLRSAPDHKTDRKNEKCYVVPCAKWQVTFRGN